MDEDGTPKADDLEREAQSVTLIEIRPQQIKDNDGVTVI
jgi:hypothetical protein